MIKDDDLLEKCNEVWKKVKNSVRKGFDSGHVYNENYLKAKVKSDNGKINTNFYNNKILEKGSHCICLSTILIDFVSRTGENYYPQLFLEECKFVVKEKKILEYMTDDIEIYSDDCDRAFSDEEVSHKQNSDEENFKLIKMF